MILLPQRLDLAEFPRRPPRLRITLPQDFKVLWFPSRIAEAEWVAGRIKDLLGAAYDDDGTVRGLTPGDFAVLMRSTRQEEQDGTARHTPFTTALENMSIRFSLEAGGGPFDRPQTMALRSTFELLRNAPLDRNTLMQHFSADIAPAYPRADFSAIVRVITNWHRQVHRPQGSTRIRLLPQQLVYDLLEAFKVAETNFSDENNARHRPI